MTSSETPKEIQRIKSLQSKNSELISADSIFYPEKPSKDSEVEKLLRMRSACDERSLEVVKLTAKALIDTVPEM